MKTPVQPFAADVMAVVLVKSPLNSWAPDAASAWAAAKQGSRTRAWTFWPEERRARATAPPWEPVAPVMRNVWGCGWDMAGFEFVDKTLVAVVVSGHGTVWRSKETMWATPIWEK